MNTLLPENGESAEKVISCSNRSSVMQMLTQEVRNSNKFHSYLKSFVRTQMKKQQGLCIHIKTLIEQIQRRTKNKVTKAGYRYP